MKKIGKKITSSSAISSEIGFVSLWFSSTTVLLLLFGITFFMYSEATITKMKTHFMVNNLAITGSHNAEFDSPESLNNMKLLASSYGYSGVSSVERAQVSADGSSSLYFFTESQPGTQYGSHVLIQLNRSPLFELFNLSELQTASYARAEPAPLYVDLAFDYSHSLNGGSINELLQAFEVLAQDGVSPGDNGESVNNKILPLKDIQTLLPHSIDPWLGIALPWDDESTIWPNIESVDESCSPSEENICPNKNHRIISHKETLRLKSSDLFLQYKKAAALLTGVLGGKTQFADVHIFGGKVSDTTFNKYTEMLAPFTADPNATGFTSLENTGLYTVSEFDEYRYSSYSFQPPSTLSGEVSNEYSYEAPKDLLREPVSFAPNRPLQLFLDNTFSRKLLKYGLLERLDNTTVPRETFYEILNPPIPELKDKPLSDDSFAFNPGILTSLSPSGPEHEQALSSAGIFLLGWSSHPIPILGIKGPAFITDGNTPWYIKNPLEYNCSTGIPLDNAASMSQDKFSLGHRLCLIHKACTGDDLNCDGPGGSITSSVANAYRVTFNGDYQSNSPGCEDDEVARCFGTGQIEEYGPLILLSAPDNLQAPVCINGVARCHPDFTLLPRCYNPIKGTRSEANFPECCDTRSGECDPDYGINPEDPRPKTHSPKTSGDADTIGQTEGEPLKRGQLIFPDTQPPDIENNIFHFLMDLTTLQGGTWTHSAVERAANRCEAFKDNFKGLDPDCVLIMTTDGMPNGIDSLGNQIKSSEEMLDSLAQQVNNFSHPTTGQNGKLFTWYLQHNPSEYDTILAKLQQLEMASELNDSIVRILNEYLVSELPIPDELQGDWDDAAIEGLPTAKVFNDSVLPQHQEREQLRNNFVAIVSPPDENSNLRYISSSVSIADQAKGLTLPTEFFQYLEQTAVQLKREVKFQK